MVNAVRTMDPLEALSPVIISNRDLKDRIDPTVRD